MYPLAENIYVTGSLYHNYQGNHIIDNSLKSSIFDKDNDLRSSGSSQHNPLPLQETESIIAATTYYLAG
jgi:hypothetical protein